MTNKADDKGQGEDFRYFLLAVRSGTDFIETATLSAAEIPLTVMSSMGVSVETTEGARETTRGIAEGVHGTVDSIAEQIAAAVSKQVSLVADSVGAAAKEVKK
jgi:hypothetical protein